MRPRSKHGLERKFKPWRKGKSSKKAAITRDAGSNSAKRPTNTSLKNRLRGQKRLLAKLQKDGKTGKEDDGKDGNDDQGSSDVTVAGVKQSIAQLERDIALYETREREKKNASKYHQVKFIERQKLTRLEKSVKRQLQALQLDTDGASVKNQQRACQLRQQIESIAMDQLYIAFYPSDRKYVALFADGYHRVVDDERGRKRRQGAWAQIKEDLRKGGGSFDKEATKKWVNLDAAKSALLAMPEGSYPSNDEIVVNGPASVVSGTTKKQKEIAVASARTANATGVPDNRFKLTKELDGMFQESTTGNDYQSCERNDSSSDSDCNGREETESTSSEDDNHTNQLHGFKGNVTKGLQNKNPVNNTMPKPSSSSSSVSRDSSDDDVSHTEEDIDDFFATDTATSMEDIFIEVQNNDRKKQKNPKRQHHDNDNTMPYWKVPDKSRGFKSQNQSKKDYRNFQVRQKRQKFG